MDGRGRISPTRVRVRLEPGVGSSRRAGHERPRRPGRVARPLSPTPRVRSEGRRRRPSRRATRLLPMRLISALVMWMASAAGSFWRTASSAAAATSCGRAALATEPSAYPVISRSFSTRTTRTCARRPTASMLIAPTRARASTRGSSMPTGVFWSFVLSCATDTMRWSSSIPKTVWATARTSRTVCLAGLLGSDEHVDLDRSTGSVGDDSHGVHPGQAAELVFEVAELGGRVTVALGRQFAVRPLTRHSDPVTPRGPRAPARTQHTAIRPPCVGAGRCRCYLWGLRGDRDPRETMRPFVRRRDTESSLGVETAGPRPVCPYELPEAKRRVRRAHSVAHAGDHMFQGVSCKRPWFALRPARQHWSQCCSPVAQ